MGEDEGADVGEAMSLFVDGRRIAEPVVWRVWGDVQEVQAWTRVPEEVTMTPLPRQSELSVPMPNPFNPVTVVRYTVGKRGRVEVGVYDVQGRRVRILVATHQDAGPYTVTWDGRDTQGRSVGSGVYLVRMQAGTFTQIRKMVLLK